MSYTLEELNITEEQLMGMTLMEIMKLPKIKRRLPVFKIGETLYYYSDMMYFTYCEYHLITIKSKDIVLTTRDNGCKLPDDYLINGEYTSESLYNVVFNTRLDRLYLAILMGEHAEAKSFSKPATKPAC